MDQTVIAAMIEKYEFSGLRVIGDHIFSVRWKLEFVLHTHNDGSTEEINESVIGYHKIKFWLDAVLDDVIFTNFESELGNNLAYSSDNVSVLVPNTPVDSHLAQLLHSKLNAICGNFCSIGEVSLEASDTTATHIFDTVGQYTLPDGSYLGDAASEKPWWARDCFETADFTKLEVESDPDLKDYLENADPLVLLENKLRLEMSDNDSDTEIETATATATIIKMPKKWTPKIV